MLRLLQLEPIRDLAVIDTALITSRTASAALRAARTVLSLIADRENKQNGDNRKNKITRQIHPLLLSAPPARFFTAGGTGHSPVDSKLYETYICLVSLN
jgi:hypothetical protein